MTRHDVSCSLSLILATCLGATAITGCAIERADANVGAEAQAQGEDGSGSGGSSSAPGPSGLGGAMTGDGDTTVGDGDAVIGDGDLFGGSCPVEPCPVVGDGDMVPVGTNLIVNGDFAAGTANWNGTNGTVSAPEGAGCVSRDTLDIPILGWDSVTIDAGTYTFSFDIVGAGPSTLTAKVGGTMDPWPAYTEQTLSAVAAGSHTFDFTMTETAQVGLAFIMTSGDACVDNVSLVKK